jgi:hypothetical protein
MEYVDQVFNGLNIAKDRLINNSIASFEGMTTQRWIRIIAIVGGYMLIRPYLLSFAAKKQKAQFEKEAAELGLDDGEVKNANSLRGGAKKANGKEVSGPGKVLGEVTEDSGTTTKRK